MPSYDYLCQACGKPFEVTATVKEYEAGLRPECPHCGQRRAIRTFGAFNVMGSARSGSACRPSAGPG